MSSSALVPMGPPAKRPRPLPTVDERLLCNPVAFTGVAPKPRMYILPVKKHVQIAADAHSSSGGSSLDASSSVSSSGGVEVTKAVPVCIPLVRPPVLQNMDDYLTLVGNMYYQAPESGRSTSSYALIRRTTIGRLTSPIREPSVLDRWAPYEIALFESGICVTGKLFPQLSQLVGSKSVKDVIEFYYVWKKSKNYKQWKASYKQSYPDE